MTELQAPPARFLELADGAGTDDGLLERVHGSGAVLEEHVVLKSGEHAGRFLRFRAVAADRELLGHIAERLRARLTDLGLTAVHVACPESAGFDLGAAIAAGTPATPAVFQVDRERRPTGRMRAGHAIRPSAEYIIVDDVVTTGRSLRTMMDAVVAAGGRVRAAVVFATQRGAPASIPGHAGVPVLALVQTLWPHVSAADCEVCKAGGRPWPAAEFN